MPKNSKIESEELRPLFNSMVAYFKFQFNENHPNHRYLSWEHCYKTFKNIPCNTESKDLLDNLALNLGFYLASWGMYRGSSFLLQKDYKIHIEPIKILLSQEYEPLRKQYNPVKANELMKELAEAYGVQPSFVELDDAPETETNGTLTDTLFTKILLGVYGTIPAYDRYCKLALSKLGWGHNLFDKKGNQYLATSSSFCEVEKNADYLEANQYCYDNYTTMKIMDMFLFECGNMLENAANLVKSTSSDISFAKKVKAIIDFDEYISCPNVDSSTIKTVFKKCHKNGKHYYDDNAKFFEKETIKESVINLTTYMEKWISKEKGEKYDLTMAQARNNRSEHARIIADICNSIRDNPDNPKNNLLKCLPLFKN